MKQINIRTAVLSDAYSLAPRLREQDLAEVYASHRMAGDEALYLSVWLSEVCYTAEYDGKAVAMFGVTPAADGGIIWLLGAKEVGELPVTLYRQSRRHVRELLEAYGHLYNYADARKSLSIQWLKWLGFVIEAAAPYGEDGQLFHRFSMGRKKDVHRD